VRVEIGLQGGKVTVYKEKEGNEKGKKNTTDEEWCGKAREKEGPRSGIEKVKPKSLERAGEDATTGRRLLEGGGRRRQNPNGHRTTKKLG